MIAMERKDLTPAIMSFLLLLAIVALALVRQWRIPNLWVKSPVNQDLSAFFFCQKAKALVPPSVVTNGAYGATNRGLRLR